MILTFALLNMSCEKITLENMSVEKYINLLKTESYDFMALPPFDSDDIPELLAYSSDDLILKRYPANPVSSFIAEDCKLGIYVLWTIESIRKSAIEDKTAIGRFPSLNPILSLKTAGDNTIDPEIAHLVAAQAYLDWWNSSDDFEQIKNINPLDETDYYWR